MISTGCVFLHKSHSLVVPWVSPQPQFLYLLLAYLEVLCAVLDDLEQERRRREWVRIWLDWDVVSWEANLWYEEGFEFNWMEGTRENVVNCCGGVVWVWERDIETGESLLREDGILCDRSLHDVAHTKLRKGGSPSSLNCHVGWCSGES